MCDFVSGMNKTYADIKLKSTKLGVYSFYIPVEVEMDIMYIPTTQVD